MMATAYEVWLEERRTGIGGSDAAAIAGLSRWRTPLDVYLDKRGEGPERPENAAMLWGRRMEPYLRDDYSNATGRVVRVPQEILRHPEYDFMIGNIDGLTDDGRLLEVKTARFLDDQWGEPHTDQVREDYRIQVQHYMAITALPVCDIGLGIWGDDLRIYTVPADVELQKLLIEIERTFWHEHVLKGIPPDPITVAEARVRWPVSEDRAVQASAETVAAVKRLGELRAEIKSLQTEADRTQTVICRAMGENDVLLDGKLELCTWKSTKKGSRVFRLKGGQ